MRHAAQWAMNGDVADRDARGLCAMALGWGAGGVWALWISYSLYSDAKA